MRFYIEKMILWLRKGKIRKLSFQNNKINIITGNSKTGKTAILEIIDYCLCGSADTVVISQEHIGENVEWYGLVIHINDKVFTIARGKISDNGSFSNDIYISQTGEIPERPYTKISMDELKEILNSEFSINTSIIPFEGSRSIKKNTVLSYRYFLMLNTLSKDVIDNGKAFFDKLEIDRYREAWYQVFDLCLGIITKDSITIQQRVNELTVEVAHLEKQLQKNENKNESIKRQIESLICEAKEAGLIDIELDFDSSLMAIKELVENGRPSLITGYKPQTKFEKLQGEYNEIITQLLKLEKFKKSYRRYKVELQKDADALKPIEYISSKFGDLLEGEYQQYIHLLQKDLKRIKESIIGKQPFESDIDKRIRVLQQKKKELKAALDITPKIDYSTISDANKLIEFGRIQQKYSSMDAENVDSTSLVNRIEEARKDLEKHRQYITEIDSIRSRTISALNEYIQSYIRVAQRELDEYGMYLAYFDYQKRRLDLRKDKEAVLAKISSSSDHLFMHLCLFAGLHEMILNINTPYAPSFLIMDQPSKPYFKKESFDYSESQNALEQKSDWFKVCGIFKLWNSFFDNISKAKHEFQIIMLEHVEEDAWKDSKYVNLVAIFDGVNDALIPPQL